MDKTFKIGYSHDKVIVIECHSLGVFLELDYDDVNHYEIDAFVPIIVRALNSITEDEWVLAQFKAVKTQKMDQMDDFRWDI